MKKLFTAIQKNDLQTIKSLLEKDGTLIDCIFGGAPKKFDGQSLLQVALKTADTDIVNYLLDKNADVNYIEDESCANDWRAPVIHDAINRAIMYSRWNVNREGVIEVFNNKQSADEAFAILERIVLLGADVNAKDSYGNAGIDRACLQARQILPRPNSDDRILTDELKSDLSRIFNLLITHGADMSYSAPSSFGKTYLEEYGEEAVGVFLFK